MLHVRHGLSARPVSTAFCRVLLFPPQPNIKYLFAHSVMLIKNLRWLLTDVREMVVRAGVAADVGACCDPSQHPTPRDY